MSNPLSVNLVVFEATGKQPFIFETNKLRENLGASQMVHESTTCLLDDALRAEGYGGDSEPVIERGGNYEIVTRSSGKSLVLCSTRERAVSLVWRVSSVVRAQLPGVTVIGAIEPFEWGSGIDRASKAAHRRLELLSARVSGQRFFRVPIVEDCATSGFAASERGYEDGPSGAAAKKSSNPPTVPRSASVFARRAYRSAGIERLARAAAPTHNVERANTALARTVEAFENSQVDWLAVVHADGNGLGAVFANFGDTVGVPPEGTSPDRYWVDRIRMLSSAVEEITERAFRDAIAEVEPVAVRLRGKQTTLEIPVVPIVLGGDDLTAVVAGTSAWDFTVAYLTGFAAHAATHPGLDGLFDADSPLTASAGIAFVKPHYPFSAAHTLAGSLAESAKKLKPQAAIDFHVLYDSASSDLSLLRSHRVVPGTGTRLWAGPYLIGAGHDAGVADGARASEATESSAPPTVAELAALAGRLLQRSDGRPVVPSAPLHSVRESLFSGWERAEQRWNSLLRRPGCSDLGSLTTKRDASRVMLLDAMALADVAGRPTENAPDLRAREVRSEAAPDHAESAEVTP